MFNEQFAAATSEEIRKTFRMKRERGEFIGAFAPYGYRKDPNDKSRLLVDEEAAEVVKSIFHWFVNEGYSKTGIAQRLSRMGEPTPEAYKRKKGFKYSNPNSGKSDGLWSAGTVARILQNEVYTGAMVQGRNRVISYKVHRQISVPEAEWFVVRGTHEAIIDRETFGKAQALHRRDTRAPPWQSGSLSAVRLLSRCADCKRPCGARPRAILPTTLAAATPIKKICSKHSIRQDKLESAVLAALQVQISLADRLTEEIERIRSAPVINRECKRLSHALEQAEKQLKQCSDAADSLYPDWKSGEITKAEYRRLKGKLAEQMQQLEANIAYLKEALQAAAGGSGKRRPVSHCLFEAQKTFKR